MTDIDALILINMGTIMCNFVWSICANYYDENTHIKLEKYNINYPEDDYKNMSNYQKKKFDQLHTKTYIIIYFIFCLMYTLLTLLNVFFFKQYIPINTNETLVFIIFLVIISLFILVPAYKIRRGESMEFKIMFLGILLIILNLIFDTAFWGIKIG